MKRTLAAMGLVVISLVGALVVVRPAVVATKCPDGMAREDYEHSIAECSVPKDKEGQGLSNTIVNIINAVLGILGIIAVVVMILGGITFLTSQGDANKVQKGKNTILYGLVGLIVALLAFAIVNFVTSNVFKSSGKTDEYGCNTETQKWNGTKCVDK